MDGMQRRLLAWSQREGRDLPWRATRDAWSVLVSEVMLQQTQVTRVVDVWPAFVGRFGSAADCAGVPLGDVVMAWAGLGYNKRAVNLHRCAGRIVAEHGGAVPDDLASLQALPGIGAYTARAILAFAFEQPVGVVDVNAGRVHARLAGRALSAREAQAAADAATPVAAAWSWNQAVLDLGAMQCTSRAPKCAHCPIAGDCAWRRGGNLEPDPAVGSAAASVRQAAFTGSDRQGRGRLVAALRLGPVDAAPGKLAETMGWPDDIERSTRVAMGVVDDGLAKWESDNQLLCLP